MEHALVDAGTPAIRTVNAIFAMIAARPMHVNGAYKASDRLVLPNRSE